MSFDLSIPMIISLFSLRLPKVSDFPENFFHLLILIILESEKSRSPPSIHTNRKLQQMIEEHKSESVVWLTDMELTSGDMGIVAEHLLQNNTVTNI